MTSHATPLQSLCHSLHLAWQALLSTRKTKAGRRQHGWVRQRLCTRNNVLFLFHIIATGTTGSDWLRLDLVRRVCLCFVAVAMTVFGAAGYRNQQYPRRPQVLELLQMQSNTETLTLTGPWLRIHGLSGLARQFDAAVSH
jgi:hypothetical protein